MNITDWLIGISALATLALAIAAFLSIRQNRRDRLEERRRQTLERIRSWAEELVAVVTRPTRHREIEARKSELLGLLHVGGAKSVGVLKDAELVGGKVYLSVGIAQNAIFRFDARLRGSDAIADFMARFNAPNVKAIENTSELEEEKEVFLTALSTVISSATE